MIFREVDIRQLFELMKVYDIGEISLSDGKTSVQVKRGGYAPQTTPQAVTAKPSVSAPAPADIEIITSETQLASAAEPPKPQAAPTGNNYYPIKSPLVGTFYRSASPEAKPYASVGDRVKSGDILCIVEAMKSMNEIQSEVSGVVREICIGNGELAEFEQVLFRIDTNA